MQIGYEPTQQNVIRTGGLYALFKLQRESVGFMLPEEKIDPNKTCELSQLIVPVSELGI